MSPILSNNLKAICQKCSSAEHFAKKAVELSVGLCFVINCPLSECAHLMNWLYFGEMSNFDFGRLSALMTCVFNNKLTKS